MQPIAIGAVVVPMLTKRFPARRILMISSVLTLIGIGIAMIDLGAVIEAFSLSYLVLVLVVVIGVAFGAGLGGQMVGFYPIESAITAGLCTTNMGGTGDIAVLSAANRMVLLPFAQISTRICGAVVLVVASILVRVLFGG